jgi:hypothetical protein
MSIRAMVWAFGVQCPSPFAKLVLLKLADHANEDGWECWPAQGRIAADCGIPRETVNRQVKALAEAGLIRVEQRTNGTGKLSNRYFLLCDAASHPDVIHRHILCDPASHKPSIEEPLREDPAASQRPPDDPVKEIFDRGLKILGGGHRSLLGKFRKSHGDEAVLDAILSCEAEGPSEPVAFFIGCLKRAPPANGHAKDSPVTKLYRGAMRAADKLDRQEEDRRTGRPAIVSLLDSR